VSALDVSVQAQILNLLVQIQERRQIALLFITHDLAVVEYLADRIAVMNQGVIVEQGEAAAVLDHPQHPYTRALLAANGVPLPSTTPVNPRGLHVSV
jgi:peptide/nickel transport system ATP-binding protein